MTTALIVAALVSDLAVLGLLAVLWRQRRRIGKLESRLRNAAVDLQSLQRSCARLAPGDLVDRMLTEGPGATAEIREATALFVDLVGFTALSETLAPGDLLHVLNGYIERMSAAIEDHRGHVSTYLGDGILAYFGALAPNPWQCNDAAAAALAMRGALAEYNETLRREGLPELAIGIGLHRGSGLIGMIGTPERMEFAFVGRTVNVAARVQGLTRLQDADILMTETVREKLASSFQLEPLSPARVKGIAEPIATYALLGSRDASPSAASDDHAYESDTARR